MLCCAFFCAAGSCVVEGRGMGTRRTQIYGFGWFSRNSYSQTETVF